MSEHGSLPIFQDYHSIPAVLNLFKKQSNKGGKGMTVGGGCTRDIPDRV